MSENERSEVVATTLAVSALQRFCRKALVTGGNPTQDSRNVPMEWTFWERGATARKAKLFGRSLSENEQQGRVVTSGAITQRGVSLFKTETDIFFDTTNSINIGLVEISELEFYRKCWLKLRDNGIIVRSYWKPPKIL